MPLNTSGQISLLRVHDVGTGYGPPSDAMDVEVVVQFAGRPADAFGFQLRTDGNGPARRGMLDLLRDAFNHDWIAHLDYNIAAGHHNGVIIRAWVTKPPKSPVVISPVVLAKSAPEGGATNPVRGKPGGKAPRR